MGGIFHKLFSKKLGKVELKIIILGLDNSGKTTFLKTLQLQQITESAPTIGYNALTMSFNQFHVQFWDLGGLSKVRKEWENYYPNTHAIIYVIDSSDEHRFGDAYAELKVALKVCMKISKNPALKGLPLLILANKQDLPDAKHTRQITEFLGLRKLKDRDWAIFQCSAVSGVGIIEGAAWILKRFVS